MLSYLSLRPNWSTEILFVFPVFFAYQVGTFYTTQRNGVDLISTLVFRLKASSEAAFLALFGVLLAALAVLYLWMRRRERFQLRMVLPVLIESAVYALVMGNLILFVMTQILGVPPPSVSLPRLGAGQAESLDAWMVVYISAGAGLHEELVFRVLVFGGVFWLLTRRQSTSRLVAMIIALALSAVLFSAAHHVPPHGEPFTLFAFLYRLLAGALFGVLYAYRGFAVAVYTHVLYDVLVLGVWA